jgi:hypothetical protein
MIDFFAVLLALFVVLAPQPSVAADKPVLAVAPIRTGDFPAAVTMTLGAKEVELARDSNEFSVFDQNDIETILHLQKQGATPLNADPVALGRMVAARKVMTTDLRKSGDDCSLGIKITDVETGLVEAAKLDVGSCLLPDLIQRTGGLWAKLLTGRLIVSTRPPGLAVSVDGKPGVPSPLEFELPIGLHSVSVQAPGYNEAAASVTLHYLERRTVQIESNLVKQGLLVLYGSPISAVVFDSNEYLGKIPFEKKMNAGVYFLTVETNAGRFPLTITVPVSKVVKQRIDLPFRSLQDFDRNFLAGNAAARGNDHSAAATYLDIALRAGFAAQTSLPTDLQEEIRSALQYVQGARALEQAWLLQGEAEATRNLSSYCQAMNEAADGFGKARSMVPAKTRLQLSAVPLARTRGPIKLGACAPEARFAARIKELDWPLAATAAVLQARARSNRLLLGELRSQKELNAKQREWLRAEESLLNAYERWANIAGLKNDLLRAPSETLPRLCASKREALGYLAAAKTHFQGVQEADVPLQSRFNWIADLENRIENAGSLCPQ